jgi:hypothetical protein
MAHKHRDRGPWEPLRALRRKLRAAQNHPHYVGNNNESLRLDQVIASSPPEGGMRSYVADLEKSSDVSSTSAPRPLSRDKQTKSGFHLEVSL